MSDKNKDKQTYRLEDVEVDTIGLVKRGANRRFFFLTKSSQTEDGNMAEQDDVQTNPAVELDDERVKELAKETVVAETEGLVANFFKGLFGGNDDADDDPDDGNTVAAVEIPEEQPEVTVEDETIQVEVLNGCKVAKLASQVGTYLASKGFDVVRVDNAPSFNYTETVVVARDTVIANALSVAQALGAGNNVIQQKNKELFLNVTVILGKDYKKLTY